MTGRVGLGLLSTLLICVGTSAASEPPKLTSLSNPAIKYRRVKKPYVVLQRGDITAVIADNSEIQDEILPNHRAGYSGVASLTHAQRDENLFVPTVAGLNYEHIHDGTVKDRKILFEPRNSPMELRVIDAFTAELYQPPTTTYRLESCLRYQLLEDGVIELTMEFIPRQDSFANGYIGLFWASYINQPESLDIHFKGHRTDGPAAADWVRGVTPAHGTRPTHLATDDHRVFPHDEAFPLTLVFNRSAYRYAEPWYYGVSHGMAWVQMFRRKDEIRISQSPSGGGRGNPAWDFQYFIPNYKLHQRYQMVMRGMYVPFESPEQIERVSRPHRVALSHQ